MKLPVNSDRNSSDYDQEAQVKHFWLNVSSHACQQCQNLAWQLWAPQHLAGVESVASDGCGWLEMKGSDVRSKTQLAILQFFTASIGGFRSIPLLAGGVVRNGDGGRVRFAGLGQLPLSLSFMRERVSLQEFAKLPFFLLTAFLFSFTYVTVGLCVLLFHFCSRRGIKDYINLFVFSFFF